MNFPASHRTAKSALLLLLAGSLIGLSACRNDRVSVNSKDPNSPQYEYRLDELALLQMAADDIQEMERKKQYGQIYDTYGSDGFKKNVSRRRFLIMSNCVETYLGGIEEFNPNEIGFRRKFLKAQTTTDFLDVLNRKIQRFQGTIEEQLVFVPVGLNFKLNGLYWIAKDKVFLQCIADSPKVEADTAPQPEESAAKPTETTQSPSQEQAAQPAKPETETSSDTEQSAKPATEPATQTEAPTPPQPVQGMKPSEIKKQPLDARPAGAGAVIDERPVVKKKKAKEDSTHTPGAPSGTLIEPENTNEPPVPQQEDD